MPLAVVPTFGVRYPPRPLMLKYTGVPSRMSRPFASRRCTRTREAWRPSQMTSSGVAISSIDAAGSIGPVVGVGGGGCFFAADAADGGPAPNPAACAPTSPNPAAPSASTTIATNRHLVFMGRPSGYFRILSRVGSLVVSLARVARILPLHRPVVYGATPSSEARRAYRTAIQSPAPDANPTPVRRFAVKQDNPPRRRPERPTPPRRGRACLPVHHPQPAPVYGRGKPRPSATPQPNGGPPQPFRCPQLHKQKNRARKRSPSYPPPCLRFPSCFLLPAPCSLLPTTYPLPPTT